MADIRVGDRVRVLQADRADDDSYYTGRTGVIQATDFGDARLPYYVLLDEAEHACWLYSVELVDKPSEHVLSAGATTDRDALVARAKEHLAGTEHTADDIIRLAEFLAG
jgi:hypothetical protein